MEHEVGITHLRDMPGVAAGHAAHSDEPLIVRRYRRADVVLVPLWEWLSRSRAKEAIEVLLERGTALACKVITGNNKRELDGFMLASQAGELDDPDTRTE